MCDPDFAPEDADGNTLGYEWKDGQTLEDYRRWPSRKLDYVATLCNHHLAEDNAPPLKVVNGELEPDLDAPRPVPEGNLPRDKIILYSAFPSNGRIIERVRRLCRS